MTEGEKRLSADEIETNRNETQIRDAFLVVPCPALTSDCWVSKVLPLFFNTVIFPTHYVNPHFA
jgi:hypothetical protein